MKPSYSAIIVNEKTISNLQAVQSLHQLPQKYQPKEIILSVGNNPSLQRNVAAQLAKGEILYFLDNDSQILPANLPILLNHFKNKRTAVVGGPNLAPMNASSFEKTVSAVLASFMGSFKVRARYLSIGSARTTTEKELILCNMMIRKETFIQKGGFNTKLYPNEENEFLNRLLHEGYHLIYDPEGYIYRPRRKNIFEFCKQAFRYGRGRAQQIKSYPCLSDIIHLAPTLFVLYILSLLTLLFIKPCPSINHYATWTPLLLFSIFSFGTGISALSWHRQWKDLFQVPALIFLRHFFYGVGCLLGFVTYSSSKFNNHVECYLISTNHKLKKIKK